MSKAEIASAYKQRRDEALAVLLPQWKRCFWTKPRGHVYDKYVCLYCGKKSFWSVLGVDELEGMAYNADRWPIANELPKGELA